MTPETATPWMLAGCCLLCLICILAVATSEAEETFTDRNKTCTMKVTAQGENTHLVGIICEQRKVLSYWNCKEPQLGGFSSFVCIEKETQYVDPMKGAQKQSKGREMRVYASDIQRVPFVLCGRLCDPTR